MKLNLVYYLLPSDTIIVSPIAREIAKTIDAIIPEVAAGNTTFVATSNFVAPNPMPLHAFYSAQMT
jgi:H+/gluconate symporter-like permease